MSRLGIYIHPFPPDASTLITESVNQLIVRHAPFGGMANGEVYPLCILPKGCRVFFLSIKTLCFLNYFLKSASVFDSLSRHLEFCWSAFYLNRCECPCWNVFYLIPHISLWVIFLFFFILQRCLNTNTLLQSKWTWLCSGNHCTGF